MKQLILLLSFCCVFNAASFAQINSFPHTESFEDDFTMGQNVYFLTDWWGNYIAVDTIYQDDTRPYSGSYNLIMIPKEEEFQTIIEADLDLSGKSNMVVDLWAASDDNGGDKTSRLFIETSSDGGQSWYPKVQLGTNTTFLNEETPYSKYTHAFHPGTFDKADVKCRIIGKSGIHHGQAAKLLIDDITFYESLVDTFPPVAIEPNIIDDQHIGIRFSEPVSISAEDVSNYVFNPSIVVSSASLSTSLDSVFLLLESPLEEGNMYTLTVSGVVDTSGNMMTEAIFEILYSTVNSGIVISEIMYDEPPVGQNDFLEFVELYNATCEPINLGGIKIKEAFTTGPFPNYTLQPGEYYVLAKSMAQFQSVFGFYPNQQWMAGNLDNEGGDYIQLLPAQHHSTLLIDSVTYEISAPWPTEGAGTGPSIEISNKFLDNSLGENWQASTTYAGTYAGYDIYATPGAGSDPELNPVLELGEGGNYCGITELTLDAENEGAIYLWSTGETSQTITVTESGEYTVVINNGFGAAFDTIEVNFVPAITAEWEVPETVLCANTELVFTDLTEGAAEWYWDFGDGSSSELQIPTHSYMGSGNYDLSLIVTSEFGCKDTLITNVGVSEINAAISPISDVNCVGSLIEFFDESDDAVEWLWDFGNDVTSTLENPTTIYLEPAIYNVTLLVSNIYGCTDITSIEANVESCTGIEEVEGITSFSLIPNPAKENFKISVVLNSNANIYIEIIDINGRIVFNESISNQSDYTRNFNSDQFGKGIYLIKVSSGENVAWKKLIIN